MLCTRCKKNQATVYFKQNINGKKSEQMLCRACFEELQAQGHGADFEDLLGSLFAPNIRSALRGNTVKACSLCGATWDELRSGGKIGCAKCYEVFADELSATVQSIHGRCSHNGRKPNARLSASDTAQKEEAPRHKNRIEAWKQELQKAIADQNFEEAARLRDAIREAENKGGDLQ